MKTTIVTKGRHGRTGTPTWRSWSAMLERCHTPSHTHWADYGGRGIKVCDRWNTRVGGSFLNFLEDMGERPEGKTLDRKDPDGDYEPSNCRWATSEQQAINKRNRSSQQVRYRGELISVSQLSMRFGIKRATLLTRIRKGWPESRWSEPSNAKGLEKHIDRQPSSYALASTPSVPMGPPAPPPTLPPALAGMDKADALAFVARLFDSAAAGDVLWDDNEIVGRFLNQCSRTGSEETKAGYRRDIDAFRSWLWSFDRNRTLRQVTPQNAEDWVAFERQQVGDGPNQRKPRSFNRRVAAVSALFRWASEPNRSTSTGIARNPLPRRQMIDVAKEPKPLTTGDLALIIKAIEDAGHRRDRVLIKGAYRLGCRVSELAALKWGDIESLDDGYGQVHLLGKGSKRRTVRISADTLALFNSLRPQSIGEDEWVFPSERRGSGHLTRQAIGSRVRHWGKVALGDDAKVWPHRLRSSHATHAIRANVDVFTLQSTLGHSSTSTTQGYVAANPADSSSLRLG